MSADCPFCILESPDCEILFDRDLVVYLQALKHQGALKYSGMIVPRAHRETVFDLTSDEISATFELLAEVKATIDSKYSPNGYTIGWNCYPTGGQSVMHAHMHVLPRFDQEPMAGLGLRAELKSERNQW